MYGLIWTLCHYPPTSQDVPIDGIWVALGAAARAGRQWIWGGPAGSGTTINEATVTTSTNYITVRRAAELAGVSHWAIRKWIKRGRLRDKQPGGNRGYLLIDKSSLINILEGET